VIILFEIVCSFSTEASDYCCGYSRSGI